MTCRTCENAAFLAGTDTLTSIARRLDYAAESDDTRAREHLLAHLHRHGQHDLAHRLSALNRQGAS